MNATFSGLKYISPCHISNIISPPAIGKVFSKKSALSRHTTIEIYYRIGAPCLGGFSGFVKAVNLWGSMIRRLET